MTVVSAESRQGSDNVQFLSYPQINPLPSPYVSFGAVVLDPAGL